MKTLFVFTVVALTAPSASAQIRIETAPGAFAYSIANPDRPMIGVSTRTSGPRDTLGLLVASVTRDGPAEQAGIEEGDRLVSVNAVNLRLSASDAGERDMEGVANRRLIRELEKRKAGDEVELRVYRDGNTRTVRVKTVAAEELNRETFERLGTLNQRLRTSGDRAALGISLGGNGSRRDTLGILVVGVSDSGPAAKAGIDEGDRIASVNGVDLRVASEDAGDWQAKSARINRLTRELEKVKAGDAVELRVYSGGQTRTVRVESAKASEIEQEGFFFGFGRGGAVAIPRAVRVRPPMVNLHPSSPRGALKAGLDRSLQSFNKALSESSTAFKLQTDALKAAFSRATSIA